MSYPHTPGHQNTDTSRDAAAQVTKLSERHESILEMLKTFGPMTSDEVAETIKDSILAIRPRLTELKRLGLVHDTGTRRKNSSGRSAIVYRV